MGYRSTHSEAQVVGRAFELLGVDNSSPPRRSRACPTAKTVHSVRMTRIGAEEGMEDVEEERGDGSESSTPVAPH